MSLRNRYVSSFRPMPARAGVAAMLLLFANAAFAQCAPPGNNKWGQWLSTQEENGGHALACHVNVTISGLIRRIEGGPGHAGPACLPGAIASAWSSEKSLIDAVKPTIVGQGAFYQNGPAGDYVLHGTARQTIGTRVYAYDGEPGKNRHACPKRKDYVCEKTRNWTMIVRKNAQDVCFLLTAYPN